MDNPVKRVAEALAVTIAIGTLIYTTLAWGRDVMRDLEALSRGPRP